MTWDCWIDVLMAGAESVEFVMSRSSQLVTEISTESLLWCRQSTSCRWQTRGPHVISVSMCLLDMQLYLCCRRNSTVRHCNDVSKNRLTQLSRSVKSGETFAHCYMPVSLMDGWRLTGALLCVILILTPFLYWKSSTWKIWVNVGTAC